MTKQGRKIVIVPIDEFTTLFLHGFNDKDELVFRSSRNPYRTQAEVPTIKDGVCYLNLYFFSSEYLNRLPQAPINE